MSLSLEDLKLEIMGLQTFHLKFNSLNIIFEGSIFNYGNSEVVFKDSHPCHTVTLKLKNYNSLHVFIIHII